MQYDCKSNLSFVIVESRTIKDIVFHHHTTACKHVIVCYLSHELQQEYYFINQLSMSFLTFLCKINNSVLDLLLCQQPSHHHPCTVNFPSGAEKCSLCRAATRDRHLAVLNAIIETEVLQFVIALTSKGEASKPRLRSASHMSAMRV